MRDYTIKVKYSSRPYRGSIKYIVLPNEIQANSALEAARQARDLAANWIGHEMLDMWGNTFRVASVEVLTS